MRAWGRRRQAFHLIQRSNACSLAAPAKDSPDVDHFAVIAQLQECWKTKCLEEVKQIHKHIIKIGKQRSRHVANVLMVAYGKCGEVGEVRRVFNCIPNPNVFSWTVLIAAFAQNGDSREALHLLKKMHLEGVEANQVTFITILTACASASDALGEGISAHNCIRNSQYESFPILQTALLDMYGKYGQVKEARAVFERMVERDIVAWSAMLGATSQAGESREAMRIYSLMSLEGVEPNEVTFIALAEACSEPLATPQDLQSLQEQAHESGYESVTVVGNSLMNMFNRRGDLDSARKAFWRIENRSVISWSIIVSAFAQDEDSCESSLFFFKLMLQEGVQPAHATLVSCLDACGSLQKLRDGKTAHSIVKWIGIQDSTVVATAALNMYSRCRCPSEAESIFEQIPVSMRDVVAWTAMIDAYQQAGSGDKAMELFRSMDLNGVRANEITFVTALQSCSTAAEARMLQKSVAGTGFEADDVLGTNLITFYGSKCGSLQDARAVFEEMPVKSLNTWNALLLGYASCLRCEETLQIFQQMELEGIRGDEYTYSRLLEVYVEAGSLSDCRKICDRIAGEGLGSSLVLSNLLISAYGKCGSLAEASQVFERMRVKNVISWSAIIAAFSRHGCSQEALEFYQRMDQEGVQPDDVTFITILFACSHSGMLHEGRRYFLAMVGDHRIQSCAKHYNCLVDLLGRAGWLSQAEELVNYMPGELSLYASTALLGACKTQYDIERAERIAARITQLDPESAAPLCLL